MFWIELWVKLQILWVILGVLVGIGYIVYLLIEHIRYKRRKK